MKKLLFTYLLIGSNIVTITACGMEDGLKNLTNQGSSNKPKNTPNQEPTTVLPAVVPDEEIALVKVTLNITKTRNSTGNICLSVFNKAEGWPSSADAAIIKRCVPAVVDSQLIDLGLPANGRYAIAVFHDENTNGDIDKTGGLGIPKEGFGFSSNPPLKIGAPSFDEVAISVGTTELTTEINLKYLL